MRNTSQHVQDFWGDPLTEAGTQSSDGKAACVQVYLAGNMGEAVSTGSVQAVRLKEELPAGINTAIIRAMGGSGSVVTARRSRSLSR